MVPLDLKYKDEQTELIVGNNNAIREFVTLNIGTKTGGGKTIIGDGNLLMAYVHVAHDCIVKNNVIIANSTQLAGHVEIDDRVTIGGCCAISQFCRLGKFSYIGGDSTINKDILPFCLAEGRWAVMRATNKIGLERGGFSKSEIESIHKAIRFVTKGNRTVDEAVEKIKAECAPERSYWYICSILCDFKKKVGEVVMSQLRAAVIGVGYLGRFHAQKYKMIESCKLIGVCDVREDSAKAVAEELDVAFFTDFKDLVGKVDLVTVATTTTTHYEVAKFFCKMGYMLMLKNP